MLWGMDDDYHHLQTRKLKFGEMEVPCSWVYRHTHAYVAEIWGEAVLMSELLSYQEPPAPLHLVKYHSLYPLASIHWVLSTSKEQWFITVIWVWHCARVKRSPCLSEIRPSPTAWAVTWVRHLSLWPAGQSRASHPPRSWEDISRQSYSRKSQQQRCPPTSTAGERGRGWGPGPGWLQTQGLQPPGGSRPELGTSPALAFGVLRLKSLGVLSLPGPGPAPALAGVQAWPGAPPILGGWGLRALQTGWTGAWASWQSISSPWNLDAWGYWIWTSIGLIYHLCFPNFYILLILFWEMTSTIALNV